MSLKDYSHEELKKTSMLELASLLLLDEKKAMNFNDIFSRVTEIKEYKDGEKENNIAQFYTDMNVDGRFMTVGSNMWGLKRWYPVEQMDEDIVSEPKKKKKKKKKTQTKAANKDTDKNQEEEEELTLNAEELDIVDEDIDEMVDELDDDDFDDETDDDDYTDDSEDDEDEEEKQ
ncbi:DNA-directed RNA polymerase subunit delta [Lentibacillus sediminis]|uniref:DNA-directed RNA polymerase subunit delta n=1 Tax=Lentibacillus sediminis TaxID=1940529 RepID=UPI000C1BF9C4|nr:DNA-directed RNA polymerase subunit delta [Lentibacillus sediminis]